MRLISLLSLSKTSLRNESSSSYFPSLGLSSPSMMHSVSRVLSLEGCELLTNMWPWTDKGCRKWSAKVDGNCVGAVKCLRGIWMKRKNKYLFKKHAHKKRKSLALLSYKSNDWFSQRAEQTYCFTHYSWSEQWRIIPQDTCKSHSVLFSCVNCSHTLGCAGYL